MIKKSTLLVVVSLLLSGLAYSQNNAIANSINKQNILINNAKNKRTISSAKDIIPFWNGWAVGFNFGLTQFDGDVRQYDHYPAYQKSSNFFELGSAFSLSLVKQINTFYSLSAELTSGRFSGLRRMEAYLDYSIHDPFQNYEGNGDKFTTTFNEADFILNIEITKAMAYFFKPKKSGNLSFETKLGVGYNTFNSLRKNLLTDTYIYGFGYNDEGVNSSETNYGTVKKDLFSSPSQTVYIYGLKAKYKLSVRMNLILDYTVRLSELDVWDASIMSTQNRKDKFSFLSIGLVYKIGNHDHAKEWESPIDGLKDDFSDLLVDIEGFTDDADNDGVSDAFDKSPNTPLGVAVDGSGNALDVDMDNIPDYRDADPFSNRDAQVNSNGKELDDDKDGVPNSIDLESKTPIGTMVNQFGINMGNANYVNSGGLIYFPSVYFNSGSAIVGNSNENRIATMALLLKNNPDVHLNVIGHTDNVGTPKFNKKLGLKRAKSVIDYLVLNYNVSHVRLNATTKGEGEPLSSVKEFNSDLENDIKENTISEINRRVDFEIVY